MRRLVSEDFESVFSDQGIHAILTPTAPTPAFAVDTGSSPAEMYVNDIFTIPASLAGLPSISVPCSSSSPSSGDSALPMGLQLISSFMAESTLLKAALSLEYSSKFFEKIPPLAGLD